MCYGVLIGAAIYCLMSPHFRIHQVNCRQNNQSCAPELLAVLEELKGKSILTTNFKDIEPSLRTAFPQMKSFVITAQFPDILQVEAFTQEAVYAVKLADEEYYSFNQAGIAMEHSSATPSGAIVFQISSNMVSDFPKTSGIERGFHQQLSIFAQALKREAQEQPPLTFHDITLQDHQQIEMKNIDNKKIFLLLPEALTALKKLRLLMKALNERQVPNDFTTIDLRFKYPVLQTASASASVASNSAHLLTTPSPSITPSPVASSGTGRMPRR
jgi:hypothetical protein